MINHVRTLLLNRGRAGFAHDFPGEEFVPAEFHPKKLPRHLLRLHQTLFGQTPDRLFLNFRLRQLLTVLHTTELASYALDFDSRITYWPLTDAALFDSAFVPEAVQLGDAAPETLYVLGEHVADEGLGLSQQVWRIEALADGVEIVTQRPRAYTTTLAYTSSQGLTLPILLPGSALTFRFHTTVPVGTVWRVSVAAKPATDIGQLFQRVETALGDLLAQFFPPPVAEPVATFQAVWRDCPYYAPRMAALLLAAATQIEQLPQDT